MIPRSPPRWLEATLGALFPASRRQECLGDLCERYASPLKYVAEALELAAGMRITEITRAFSRRRRANRHAAASISARSRHLEFITGRLVGVLAASARVGQRSPHG